MYYILCSDVMVFGIDLIVFELNKNGYMVIEHAKNDFMVLEND